MQTRSQLRHGPSANHYAWLQGSLQLCRHDPGASALETVNLLPVGVRAGAHGLPLESNRARSPGGSHAEAAVLPPEADIRARRQYMKACRAGVERFYTCAWAMLSLPPPVRYRRKQGPTCFPENPGQHSLLDVSAPRRFSDRAGMCDRAEYFRLPIRARGDDNNEGVCQPPTNTRVQFQPWQGGPAMQAANRGLSGKARRVHHRKRAERLNSQQMIEETLNPTMQDTPHRHIPIRGRRRFLPSIAYMGKVVPVGTGRQLELPLASADRTRTAARSTGLGFKPPEQLEATHRFTVGGFLLGCAMGSAAAAMVLLVVQVTVG